jgi:hypothetical protein
MEADFNEMVSPVAKMTLANDLTVKISTWNSLQEEASQKERKSYP